MTEVLIFCQFSPVSFGP